MTSPTALRALAAQLEQAGWTSVVATRRGQIVSISGFNPSGRHRSGACSLRGAAALVTHLLAQEEAS